MLRNGRLEAVDELILRLVPASSLGKPVPEPGTAPRRSLPALKVANAIAIRVMVMAMAMVIA